MKEITTLIWSYLVEFAWFAKPAALLVLWIAIDRAVQMLVRKLCRVTASRIKHHVLDEQTQRTVSFRARTICQFSTQIARGFVAVVMGFWFLGSLGIDMRPVLAGVGVVGIALSLGAQNIIRDYLNGFLILFEDQYNVGDFVTIGAQSGTVEYFSLRATKLRDVAGNLITIPNSTIQVVVNSNKNWSAAVVDLGITYESDFKKAMELAKAEAEAIAADRENRVIDTPVVQGINSFGDNAVGLRVIIKTQTGQQWAVARLFRAKIKNAFDAAGVNLAYPQLVIHATEREVSEKADS